MRKIFYLFFIIFIYSCESDSANNSDEESQNPAEVDQVLVENGIQTLMDCLEFLETGDFSNLLIDIYDDAIFKKLYNYTMRYYYKFIFFWIKIIILRTLVGVIPTRSNPEFATQNNARHCAVDYHSRQQKK